jgi:hypothetical protein
MHCGSAMSTTVVGSPPQGQAVSRRLSRRTHRTINVGLCLASVAVGCGWGLTRRLSEYR